MVLRGFAACCRAGLFMGYVDDELKILLFGGLGEDDRGLDQSLSERKAEIAALNAFHGEADVPQAHHVAENNLGAQIAEAQGTIIIRSYQRSDMKPLFQQALYGRPAGITGCGGHEYGCHACSPL